MPESTARPAAQPGTTVDPYLASNFKLVINGITEASFKEVAGLGARFELLSWREAGNNSIVRAIPGQVTYPPVTLRSGVTSSRSMWDWLMATMERRLFRRSVHVVVLDPSGSHEVLRWHLQNAWPQEWAGEPLDTMSRSFFIQTLVLAHDGLVREEGGGGGAPTP